MKRPDERPREGVLREDADTADREGFIAPPIGDLEHALYFTTAPSVIDKAKQVLDERRLLVPGVVVVWDETVGRRRGSKAVPKSWWAGVGSLTVAFAFPEVNNLGHQEKRSKFGVAVVRAIESLRPCTEIAFRLPNDLYAGDKKMGAVFVESYKGVDLVVIRLNCSTDFSKAPKAIAAVAGRLIDFINVQELPLQQAGTLPNTLLTRLMSEIPKAFFRRE